MKRFSPALITAACLAGAPAATQAGVIVDLIGNGQVQTSSQNGSTTTARYNFDGGSATAETTSGFLQATGSFTVTTTTGDIELTSKAFDSITATAAGVFTTGTQVNLTTNSSAGHGTTDGGNNLESAAADAVLVAFDLGPTGTGADAFAPASDLVLTGIKLSIGVTTGEFAVEGQTGFTAFTTDVSGNFALGSGVQIADGARVAVRNSDFGSNTTPFRLDELTIDVLPEPASLALVTLGGLCLLGRRRSA